MSQKTSWKQPMMMLSSASSVEMISAVVRNMTPVPMLEEHDTGIQEPVSWRHTFL